VAKHVKFLNGKNGSVHYVAAESEYTLCGVPYLSVNTFEGNRIPLAATTHEPLTCGRCSAALRTEIYRVVRAFPPAQTEALFNNLTRGQGIIAAKGRL
jgi:hypothetical protein